jgi:hypothetical protein
VGRYKGKRWRQDGVEWNGSNQKGKGTIKSRLIEPNPIPIRQRNERTRVHHYTTCCRIARMHSSTLPGLTRSLARSLVPEPLTFGGVLVVATPASPRNGSLSARGLCLSRSTSPVRSGIFV